jgi:hypothetical protein
MKAKPMWGSKNDDNQNQRLRALVDSSTPLIYAGGWERFCNDGWRWVQNFQFANPLAAQMQVRDLQREHGSLNVAAGHAFDAALMKPRASDTAFGIYVKDVDELVSDLYADLASFGGES